jgi:predicted unusual protein kinase regulating ubiquinone biosynthesis (AarF/ABC1/UbiB family)
MSLIKFLIPDPALDPHAGNLLIRPSLPYSRSPYNFEIALLDHGLVISPFMKFLLSLKDLCLVL